ncbi:MAG: hypothetical protein SFZ03_10985 [Candidatus Melainabacteria bacterium]|nr:hypothetical protein [Candidatus Melainabacteria bacterium]
MAINNDLDLQGRVLARQLSSQVLQQTFPSGSTGLGPMGGKQVRDQIRGQVQGQVAAQINMNEQQQLFANFTGTAITAEDQAAADRIVSMQPRPRDVLLSTGLNYTEQFGLEQQNMMQLSSLLNSGLLPPEQQTEVRGMLLASVERAQGLMDARRSRARQFQNFINQSVSQLGSSYTGHKPPPPPESSMVFAEEGE